MAMEATTTEGETYQWTRLSEDSFRVLEILCLEPILSIRLAEYRFQSPPEYHAISYTWGDEKPTEAILCDGCMLHITPNLREALSCIFSASKCHILWVDAICIDQRNDLEKALQVASMHRIFQSAKSVFVWLGQADLESDIAMAAIDEVKDKLPKATDDLFDTLLHMKSHNYNKIFDLSKFKPLLSLSQRAWFRRLWIAQEFIVGHSISVICGLKILDSSSFLEVTGRLTTLSFGTQQPELDELGDSPFEGFRMLWRINEIKESVTQKKATRFFDLVMFGRDKETFEPVDHIYAVLGLAEGSDEIYRKQIDVDYSEKNRKSYWNTFASFGKVALLHESHLKLLAYTASTERPPDLPSWCPNLNSTALTTAFGEIYAAGWPAEDHRSDHGSQENLASSCVTAHPSFKGKNENHVRLSSSSNSITIPGATLDQISTVGYSCAWGPDFNTDNLYTTQPFAKEFLKWIEDCQKICLDVLNDKDIADWVLEEVLVGANDRKHDEKVPPEPGSTKKSSLKFLISVLLQILDLEPESAGQDQNPKLYEWFEPLLAWIVVLQEEWYNRVLFATKNGRLGMASKDIEVGDSVCLLYSGRTMYILRPSGLDSCIHRFVSDAFVFRFMNGETFNLMHSGEVKEEHFIIE